MKKSTFDQRPQCKGQNPLSLARLERKITVGPHLSQSRPRTLQHRERKLRQSSHTSRHCAFSLFQPPKAEINKQHESTSPAGSRYDLIAAAQDPRHHQKRYVRQSLVCQLSISSERAQGAPRTAQLPFWTLLQAPSPIPYRFLRRRPGLWAPPCPLQHLHEVQNTQKKKESGEPGKLKQARTPPGACVPGSPGSLISVDTLATLVSSGLAIRCVSPGGRHKQASGRLDLVSLSPPVMLLPHPGRPQSVDPSMETAAQPPYLCPSISTTTVLSRLEARAWALTHRPSLHLPSFP